MYNNKFLFVNKNYLVLFFFENNKNKEWKSEVQKM